MQFIEQQNEIYILNDKKEKIAYVKYPQISEGVVCITSTFVDESLRGMRIASVLLEKAYDSIKLQNTKVIAQCSYAQKWFEKNPSKKDILLKK